MLSYTTDTTSEVHYAVIFIAMRLSPMRKSSLVSKRQRGPGCPGAARELVRSTPAAR